MKAEYGNQPKAFKPIVVTLETAEEAKLLWALLNIAGTDVVKNKLQNSGTGYEGTPTLIENMWSGINSKYTREGVQN